jgi:hypothetical protein
VGQESLGMQNYFQGGNRKYTKGFGLGLGNVFKQGCFYMTYAEKQNYFVLI